MDKGVLRMIDDTLFQELAEVFIKARTVTLAQADFTIAYAIMKLAKAIEQSKNA